MTDQEKVDKFNELRAWVRSNKEKFELNRLGTSYWESLTSSAFTSKLRLKPKKKFTPFKVKEGWEVSLIDGEKRVKIGCQDFNRADLLHDLKGTKNGLTVPLTDFRVNRQGLYNPSTNRTLSWESADQILEALEAYEKE